MPVTFEASPEHGWSPHLPQLPGATLCAAQGPSGQRQVGGWWIRGWASPPVVAGITDRRSTREGLLASLGVGMPVVEAEQTHGAGIAAVERPPGPQISLPGCDALMTRQRGIALLVRSADCIPILVADPVRAVVAIAHAGWRGLAAWLPMRLVTMCRVMYQSRPDDLRVAIGPAIRSCCYVVEETFARRFGSFVTRHDGTWRCDLVGIARDQLLQGGVLPQRVWDAQRCTACEADTWWSWRRDGVAAGRMTSLIALQPSGSDPKGV